MKSRLIKFIMIVSSVAFGMIFFSIENTNAQTPDMYGFTDISYTFGALASDSDNDQIYYYFDWGDGTSTRYPASGFIDGGTDWASDHVEVSHDWTESGIYYVRVQAADEIDPNDFSDASDEFAVSVQDEPGNAGHSGNTTNSITWIWTITNEAGVDSYNIYSDIDVLIDSVSPSSTKQYIQNSLTVNSQYGVKIKAVNSLGESNFSSTAYAYTSANVPLSISGTAMSDVEIDWSWASGGGQYGFETARNFSGPWTDRGSNLSWWESGLDCDNSYSLYVRAYNNDFDRTSAVQSGTVDTLTCPPGPFNLYNVTPDRCDLAPLQWQVSANSSEYRIFRDSTKIADCQAGGSCVPESGFQGNGSCQPNCGYDDSSVSAGHAYAYHVQAYNASGVLYNSTTNPSCDGSVGGLCQLNFVVPLCRPSNLVGPENGQPCGSIQVSWTSVPGNFGYRIYKSLDGSSFDHWQDTAQGVETFTDEEIISNQVYYYQITAWIDIEDSIVESEPSSIFATRSICFKGPSWSEE